MTDEIETLQNSDHRAQSAQHRSRILPGKSENYAAGVVARRIGNDVRKIQILSQEMAAFLAAYFDQVTVGTARKLLVEY
jgi:predicted phage-related endonuclease